MDIDKIKAVQNLDNAQALEAFVGKFPVEMKTYIKHVSDMMMKGKSGSDSLNLFMLEERQRDQMLKCYKEAGGKTIVDNMPRCAYCNKTGHEEKMYYQKYGKDSDGKTTNAADGRAKEQIISPICNIGHIHTNPKGNTQGANRFINCPKFMLMPVSERACQMENIKGCVMCLDYRGSHEVLDCWLFKSPCGVVACAKMHNKLLHGSNNWYCNIL